MTPLVKICGTTSPQDARLAVAAGANFVGVVLHPPSPRFVLPVGVEEVRNAIEEEDATVGLVLVTVNMTLEASFEIWERYRPRALQLHGDESPQVTGQLVERGCAVWKVLSGNAETMRREAEGYQRAGAEVLLVDARASGAQGMVYGGTGQVADWSAARQLVDQGYRVMLAGGLDPVSVVCASETVRPWAVDVVSGVEAQKGVKDARKVRDFVRAVTTGAVSANERRS